MKSFCGKFLWVALGLAFIANITAVRSPVEAQNPAAPDPGKQFGAKVLAIYQKSGHDSGYVLGRASFVDVGGRRFLTGQSIGAAREGDWTAGQNIFVAWDDVVSFVEFDDAASYARKVAEFQLREKERAEEKKK